MGGVLMFALRGGGKVVLSRSAVQSKKRVCHVVVFFKILQEAMFCVLVRRNCTVPYLWLNVIPPKREFNELFMHVTH